MTATPDLGFARVPLELTLMNVIPKVQKVEDIWVLQSLTRKIGIWGRQTLSEVVDPEPFRLSLVQTAFNLQAQYIA
jgi:hypothetical protein